MIRKYFCVTALFLSMFALVGLYGCRRPVDTPEEPIESAVAALADTSVEPILAAFEMQSSVLASYQANGLEYTQESLDAAIRSLGSDPEILFNLAQRSAEIPPHTVFVDSSQTKTKPRNLVLFVNGILTEYGDFYKNVMALDTLLQPLHQVRDFNVAGLYNPTGGAWIDGGEVLVQNILDWLGLYEKSEKYSFSDEFLAELTEVLDVYENILIVAHSQGNFYTQEAIARLPILKRTRINVIQVGSPASKWPAGLRNNVRIDRPGDIVSCLSGFDVVTGLPAPHIETDSLFDLLLYFQIADLQASLELNATLACWGVGFPYETYGVITGREFFSYHAFNNYVSERGYNIYDGIDAFCTDGQPLNEINIVGTWMNTDITDRSDGTDPGRPFDEYHTTVFLDEGGTADYYECNPYCHWGTAEWSFDPVTGAYRFESDGGAIFDATLTGDSATFIANGTWSNNSEGSVLYVRLVKEAPLPEEGEEDDMGAGFGPSYGPEQ